VPVAIHSTELAKTTSSPKCLTPSACPTMLSEINSAITTPLMPTVTLSTRLRGVTTGTSMPP
jgi:hypothetical protein